MGSVEDDEGEQPDAKQEHRKIIPQVEIGSKRLSQTEWAAVRLGQPFLGDASVISIIILDLLDSLATYNGDLGIIIFIKYCM